ncbi:MAG: VOC family protein [Candidatus Eremiobacteraeota bacterium]|nr:VOC family protein [Candidatus Eremiobacteraeota bacterium]
MENIAAVAGTKILGVDIFGPATRDAKRLVAFYQDVLGMTPSDVDENGSGAEFELADGTTFGVWQPSESPTSGEGYTALFAVKDINAAVALFRSRGAKLGDPFETPVCFMSFGTDPDGNEFGIHQRK